MALLTDSDLFSGGPSSLRTVLDSFWSDALCKRIRAEANATQSRQSVMWKYNSEVNTKDGDTSYGGERETGRERDRDRHREQTTKN